MPRTKLSSTNPASAATTVTLNDFTHPYPTPSTSPLLVPTLPPPHSPLSTALTSPLSLRAPNQQHIHDSTLSLPIGTTLTIPRKNGGHRIGQSILGQLLAHKPSRDHHKLANDATLSLETIRPKEQQRRSILPPSWTMSFQKPATSTQGSYKTSSQNVQQHSSVNMVPGLSSSSNRNVMENLDQSDQQPILPSVWLESVLTSLSRSETNTLSHYATLPRVDLHERRRPALQPLFADEKTNATKSKPTVPSSSKPSSKSKRGATLNVGSQTLSRKGSACELALGDDARELFQQNRPKTLSSAVISSSIVPTKESLRNVRQLSLDSDTALKPSVQPLSAIESAPKSSAPPSTTTRTKGRFIIESLSPTTNPDPNPNPVRTRTLSCTVATSSIPLLNAQPSIDTERSSTLPPEKSVYPKPPSSPTRSFSLPPPSPTTVNRAPPKSSHTNMSPSPSPSSRFTVTDYFSNGASNSSTSNPILIPRTNHNRTQSNSSSASTSSKRSQVIIPPPISTSSLQFASFSSIATPDVGPRRAGPSNVSNNFRNLSIQIVDNVDKCDTSPGSHDGQLFHIDTPSIHPFDEDESGPYSTRSEMHTAHQTMNRVHPNQVSFENSGDYASTSCSSVSSLSSSVGNYGSGNRTANQYGYDQNHYGYERNSPGVDYFRQRSLSTTNLDLRPSPHRSPSHGSLQTHQEGEMWSERSKRRALESSSECSDGIPIKGMSQSRSASVSSSFGEVSDIVIKKSATGRMFTVERTIPASPTKSSRFIVGPTQSPTPSLPSPLQK
ncbi:hypothetical protein BGZ49_006495 [Haplosporangium sp. Z 27]|nr:hypothetical protein BGZ49_006495 [Haplosporangium sp. Z 27]